MKTRTFTSPNRSTPTASLVIDTFRNQAPLISSDTNGLSAPSVLRMLTPDLERAGFSTAIKPEVKSKKSVELRADDPGQSNICRFDALHRESSTVLMVHAGQGVTNNAYLKSVFHASLAPDVRHLIIAVREHYNTNPDYETVEAFLSVLLASRNTNLDLDSVTLIGY